MNFVQKYKKKKYKEKFRDIDKNEYNIDSFNNLHFIKKEKIYEIKQNQLFSTEFPPFDFVEKIINTMLNINLNDKILYSFSRKILETKGHQEKKIASIIIKSLGSLDSRFIYYGNYYDIPMDIDEFVRFKSSIQIFTHSPSFYVHFNYQNFINKFFKELDR
jgi:hypothetical protein